MMAKSNIMQENRVRRIAKRRGFTLKRSARRDPQALDYGKYWLDDITGARVVGGEWGAELDDVEVWLMNWRR